MPAWKSSMELGDLIATTPALLNEVEHLVAAPWVHLPRGTRVRLRKAITKVRVDLGQVKDSTVRMVARVPSPGVAIPSQTDSGDAYDAVCDMLAGEAPHTLEKVGQALLKPTPPSSNDSPEAA